MSLSEHFETSEDIFTVSMVTWGVGSISKVEDRDIKHPTLHRIANNKGSKLITWPKCLIPAWEGKSTKVVNPAPVVRIVVMVSG